MNRNEETFRAIIARVSELSKIYTQLEATPRTFGSNHKLHCVEIHLIEAIGTLGETNTTELAKHLDVTKGAISQKIAKLSQLGLVQKSGHGPDKRSYTITLTQEGVVAFEGHARFHQEIFEAFVADNLNQSKQDLLHLEKDLERLVKIFSRF